LIRLDQTLVCQAFESKDKSIAFRIGKGWRPVVEDWRVRVGAQNNIRNHISVQDWRQIEKIDVQIYNEAFLVAERNHVFP